MRDSKRLLLIVVIAFFAAVPGMAIEEEHETTDGCCWGCAHYIYTSPDGTTQERWDCMGFDCRSGYVDCWQHADSSKACIMMWNCSYF